MIDVESQSTNHYRCALPPRLWFMSQTNVGLAFIMARLSPDLISSRFCCQFATLGAARLLYTAVQILPDDPKTSSSRSKEMRGWAAHFPISQFRGQDSH